MSLWPHTVTRMPRLRATPAINPDGEHRSAAFPLCTTHGGLCDTLLNAVPMSIIGIQFIRDDSGVVQDGLIVFANASAQHLYGGGKSLLGARLLANCQELLFHGIWQRCLWATAHGRTETMIEQSTGGLPHFLTIAPYQDGLILCRSVDPVMLEQKDADIRTPADTPRRLEPALAL
jgi:hypothetical protein